MYSVYCILHYNTLQLLYTREGDARGLPGRPLGEMGEAERAIILCYVIV